MGMKKMRETMDRKKATTPPRKMKKKKKNKGRRESGRTQLKKKKSSEGSYWLQEKKSLHAAQNLNLLLSTPSVLAGCISMFKSVELNIIEQTISSWAFGINGLYLLLHFVFVDQ